MRKRLSPENKRSTIIGVKVTQKVKQQIEYLAERDATKVSSYIAELIQTRIDQFTKDSGINWEEELERNERG